MRRILVSACLLGRPVRYDGRGKRSDHPVLDLWRREGRLVPLCPEVAAGFPTPRPPAEIASGSSLQSNDARALAGGARVVERGGRDVTAQFLEGARIALETARAAGCRYAVLTDGSPSCGSSFVYDGSFSGVRRPGRGVVAAHLAEHEVRVFAESDLDSLAALLRAEEG